MGDIPNDSLVPLPRRFGLLIIHPLGGDRLPGAVHVVLHDPPDEGLPVRSRPGPACCVEADPVHCAVPVAEHARSRHPASHNETCHGSWGLVLPVP